MPGYDYAPAWVSWRHDDVDGVVGWAPLPPGALFIDGGWRFNGVRVGADFDFGIGAGFFCFVDGGHFWDRDFRHYAVGRDRLMFVFGHSAFENHFRYDHGRFFNDGIDRDRMARLTHRDVRDFQPRRMEEIRHQEEAHHMEARRDDVRNFHPGDHPDARGGLHADVRVGGDVRVDVHADVHAGGPAHGPAESHAGAPAGGAGHAAAAPSAGGQKAAPQSGAKGGGKDEKKNN